mgnify:CR=1
MALVDYPRLEYISTSGIPWQTGISRLQGSLIFSEGGSLNALLTLE